MRQVLQVTTPAIDVVDTVPPPTDDVVDPVQSPMDEGAANAESKAL